MVEDRPILSAEYHLPLFGQNWPTPQRGLSAIAELVMYMRASVIIPLKVCERDILQTNRLCEFLHIYNLCAGRDNDELIRFWGQNVKGQRSRSHQEQIWSKEHSRRHRLSDKPPVGILSDKIYNSDAFLDEDELVRFWGQRSTSQCDQIWPEISACSKCTVLVKAYWSKVLCQKAPFFNA